MLIYQRVYIYIYTYYRLYHLTWDDFGVFRRSCFAMDKDAAALVLQARHRQCVEELFDDYAEDFDEHLSSLGWWETSILRCSRFPLLLGEMLNLRSWVLRNKNGILNGYNMLTIKNEFEFG